MINLIPPDFAPTGKTAKLARLIRNTGLVLFSIFLVSTLVMIGIFIYYAVSLTSVKAKENQLKNSIASLESTEQKLVLIKDRLGYANTILNKETSLVHIDKLGLITQVPGINLTRSEMISIKNDSSLVITDLGSLSNLFSRLKTGEIYKHVILNSFNFNPASGYQVSLTMSDKTQ